MSYTRLPEYTFRKKYSNCFLFTTFEINKRGSFNHTIQIFSLSLGGKSITVEILNIQDDYRYNEYSFHNISNMNPKSLFSLSEKKIAENTTVEDICLEFYLTDESGKWEFFISEIDETAVLGCEADIVNIVLKTLKPYEEMTVDDKLNLINGMEGSEYKKKKFNTALLKNYNKFRI